MTVFKHAAVGSLHLSLVLALVGLLLTSGCVSLQDHQVTIEGCPEMRFDPVIKAVDADTWADEACYAFLGMHDELERIYEESSRPWTEDIRVQLDPIIGVDSHCEERSACIPNEDCVIQFLVQGDSTPHLRWWVSEVHAMWRAHVYGLGLYLDREYPSVAQVHEAAIVGRIWW